MVKIFVTILVISLTCSLALSAHESHTEVKSEKHGEQGLGNIPGAGHSGRGGGLDSSRGSLDGSHLGKSRELSPDGHGGGHGGPSARDDYGRGRDYGRRNDYGRRDDHGRRNDYERGRGRGRY